MWQFLTNMPIARRLMMTAAITALIPGIVIAILGSSYLNTLSTINETVQAGNNAVKLATSMQADILRMNALLEVLSVSPKPTTQNVENSREITELTNDFSLDLATYQRDYQITTSPKMKSTSETLQNDMQGNQAPISQHTMIYVVNLQWEIYKQSQDRALQDIQYSISPAILAGDVDQANLDYLPLKGNVDNMVGLTESISQIVATINTIKIYPLLLWTIIAFFCSTLVVFAISYLINLTITRPLRQLIYLTERIAQGETSARATLIGHDETYMVATSMNTMLDSIVRLMQNVQRQHDFLEARVQELISEITGLGSGDLRARAEVTSDALGFLAHSFNCMIDELSNLVVRVKAITEEVEVQTRTTQARMTRLVTVSERQTQMMTEAVGAMRQMVDTTFTTMEESLAIVALVRETRQMAARLLHTNTSLDPLLDKVERQAQAIDHITISFSQQAYLSQIVLQAILEAADASNTINDDTKEEDSHIRTLVHLTTRLRALVGAFKLREDAHFHFV